MGEAPAKFGVGFSQGLFGIHFEVARQIDEDEQQIADFTFDFALASPASRASANSRSSSSSFLEHLHGCSQSKPTAAALEDDLLRFHQRRKIAWDRIQAPLR